MKYADLFIIFGRWRRGLRDADFMVTGRAPNRNETVLFLTTFLSQKNSIKLVKI